jgi:hypothetical protein
MKNTRPITILGEVILPGESKTIDMEIAKLPWKLKIPIIIQRSKLTVPQSFSAGILGDEINGWRSYVN